MQPVAGPYLPEESAISDFRHHHKLEQLLQQAVGLGAGERKH